MEIISEIADTPEQGDESILAFLWQMYGNKAARDQAKSVLLEGDVSKWGFPYSDRQWVFAWAVIYDWLSESMTAHERRTAWQRFVKKDRTNRMSNFGFLQRGLSAPPFKMNHNDSWGKSPACFEAAVAFAIRNDGVADELAEAILEHIYDNDPSYCSPYRMLDWMNLMALDSGGSQADHPRSNAEGYIGFYMVSPPLLSGYWESATGENIWARNNYYRYFPLWAAYDSHVPLLAKASEAMEIVAGRYQLIDPEMARLAAWHLENNRIPPDRNAHLLPRLIWGDKRLKPHSPEDLALPLARELRGADMFVSRSSWDSDATVVNVATRTLDTLRFEPYPGALSIYRGKTPILVDSRKEKWQRKLYGTSAVDVLDPGSDGLRGIGSMYRGIPARFRPHGRPETAREIVSHGAYYSNTLKHSTTSGWYTSATIRYEDVMMHDKAQLAERTVLHIHADKRRKHGEYVVVIDRIDADEDAITLIGWRLATTPQLDGDTFSWDEASATVMDKAGSKPFWIGGIGHELETPDGDWAGAGRHGYVPGYSQDPARAEILGIGNVYVKGLGTTRTITVIKIGKGPPPLARWLDDRFAISFDGFSLTIQADGFEIERGLGANKALSEAEEQRRPWAVSSR